MFENTAFETVQKLTFGANEQCHMLSSLRGLMLEIWSRLHLGKSLSNFLITLTMQEAFAKIQIPWPLSRPEE